MTTFVDVLPVDSVILPAAQNTGKVTLVNYGPVAVWLGFDEPAVVGTGQSVGPNGGQYTTSDGGAIHALHGSYGPINLSVDPLTWDTTFGRIALSDVQDQDVPVFDAATGQFKNAHASGGGGGGDGILKRASLTLSAADLLDLVNTPIEIIPSPGAGKYISVLRAIFRTHSDIPSFPINGVVRVGNPNNYYQVTAPFSAGADKLYECPLPIPSANTAHPLVDCEDKAVLLMGDAASPFDAGSIVSLVISDGGTAYTVGDSKPISIDSYDATLLVTAVDEYTGPITGVILGGNSAGSFIVAGDRTRHFASDGAHSFIVTGSTGNDGLYNMNTVSFDGDNTTIIPQEPVSDPTVDGTISSPYGPITDFTLTDPGTGYRLQNDAPLSAVVLDHPALFDITDVVIGNGSLDVILQYTIEDIL